MPHRCCLLLQGLVQGFLIELHVSIALFDLFPGHQVEQVIPLCLPQLHLLQVFQLLLDGF